MKCLPRGYDGKRPRQEGPGGLAKEIVMQLFSRRWVHGYLGGNFKKKDSKFFPNRKIQQKYRPTKKVYI